MKRNPLQHVLYAPQVAVEQQRALRDERAAALRLRRTGAVTATQVVKTKRVKTRK